MLSVLDHRLILITNRINYLQLRKYPEEFTVSGSRLKKFMDYDKEIITKMMKNYNKN